MSRMYYNSVRAVVSKVLAQTEYLDLDSIFLC